MASFLRYLLVIGSIWTSEGPLIANCPDEDQAKVINYVPTVFSGTASLILSGAGYVVDAGYFITSRLVTSGVACGVPIIAIGSSSPQMMSHLFEACSDLVVRSMDSDYLNSNIGSFTFRETKSWRCPMFVN